jgi:hypothetical protein
VTEWKDLKIKMIINDSEGGDDKTRVKEKREGCWGSNCSYGRPRTISSTGAPHARI